MTRLPRRRRPGHGPRRAGPAFEHRAADICTVLQQQAQQAQQVQQVQQAQQAEQVQQVQFLGR
jgi:hypothetical protein